MSIILVMYCCRRHHDHDDDHHDHQNMRHFRHFRTYDENRNSKQRRIFSRLILSEIPPVLLVKAATATAPQCGEAGSCSVEAMLLVCWFES